MKTTKSLTKKVAVMMTAASLMLLTAGPSTAFTAGATLQENEASWGKPIAVQQLDDGAEKRFYRYGDTGAIGYPYYVYRDGKVIDEGLAIAVPEPQKAEKTGLAFSTLSKDYYQNHPTTVQKVESVWGKAVAVRSLEDGTRERYYKYQNTAYDLGYRCFLEKDNKVIASVLARVTGVPESKLEMKGLPVRSMKKPGVESIAEVEETWGRPVKVRTLVNGAEERYYKYGNTMLNDFMAMFLFMDGKVIGTTVAN